MEKKPLVVTTLFAEVERLAPNLRKDWEGGSWSAGLIECKQLLSAVQRLMARFAVREELEVEG